MRHQTRFVSLCFSAKDAADVCALRVSSSMLLWLAACLAAWLAVCEALSCQTTSIHAEAQFSWSVASTVECLEVTSVCSDESLACLTFVMSAAATLSFIGGTVDPFVQLVDVSSGQSLSDLRNPWTTTGGSYLPRAWRVLINGTALGGLDRGGQFTISVRPEVNASRLAGCPHPTSPGHALLHSAVAFATDLDGSGFWPPGDNTSCSWRLQCPTEGFHVVLRCTATLLPETTDCSRHINSDVYLLTWTNPQFAAVGGMSVTAECQYVGTASPTSTFSRTPAINASASDSQSKAASVSIPQRTATQEPSVSRSELHTSPPAFVSFTEQRDASASSPRPAMSTATASASTKLYCSSVLVSGSISDDLTWGASSHSTCLFALWCLEGFVNPTLIQVHRLHDGTLETFCSFTQRTTSLSDDLVVVPLRSGRCEERPVVAGQVVLLEGTAMWNVTVRCAAVAAAAPELSRSGLVATYVILPCSAVAFCAVALLWWHRRHRMRDVTALQDHLGNTVRVPLLVVEGLDTWHSHAKDVGAELQSSRMLDQRPTEDESVL